MIRFVRPIQDRRSLAGATIALLASSIIAPVHAQPELIAQFERGTIAMEGDLMVLGNAGDALFGSDAGVARIYRFDGVKWELDAELRPPELVQDSVFGGHVDIDGGVMVTNALIEIDQTDEYAGKFYIYQYDGVDWDLDFEYFDPIATGANSFSEVAVFGDLAVVGIPADDQVAPNAGAVVVFRREGGNWGRVQTLFAPDGASGDAFGNALWLSKDLLVVAAEGRNTSRGAVYVFRFDGVSFQYEATILPPDDQPFDGYASSVAARGDQIFVSRSADDELADNAGAVFVYGFADGVGWGQLDKLMPATLESGGLFGRDLGIHEDRLIVGGSPLFGAENGFAYVFENNGFAWVERARVESPDPMASGDRFGQEVSARGDLIVASDLGSTYVYGLNCNEDEAFDSTLIFDDPFSFGNPVGENVGGAVALDGDLVVFSEDWSGDFLEIPTSQVSVHRQVGGAWVPDFVIESPNGIYASDRFGFDVALDDGLLAIAHPSELVGGVHLYRHSFSFGWVFEETLPIPATSVDVSGDVVVAGERDTNTVHVYRRHISPSDFGVAWLPEAILDGSAEDPPTWFGADVAISGHQIAIGQPLYSGIAPNAGRVVVLRLTPTTGWGTGGSTIETNLGGAMLGTAVAMDHPLVAGGAPFAKFVGGLFNVGFAGVRRDTGSGWATEDIFVPESLTDRVRLGASLAVDGDRFLLGRPWDNHPVFGAGSVDLYRDVPGFGNGSVEFVARFGPGPVGSGHGFGTAVAMQWPRVAIGAPGDTTSAAPTFHSGAVRVFEFGPCVFFCLGNANADDEVNFGDITAVLGNWLADYRPGTGPGDANGDGLVNFGDITGSLGNWLSTCLAN